MIRACVLYFIQTDSGPGGCHACSVSSLSQGVCHLTDFPRFKKIDVNGENAEPLFAFLAAEKPFEGFGKGIENAALNKFADRNNRKFGDKAYIKWNFTKFPIDREGRVIARFEPTVDMKAVYEAVSAAL